MILAGLGVFIHANKTTYLADRRDPDRVKRIIDTLNEENGPSGI